MQRIDLLTKQNKGTPKTERINKFEESMKHTSFNMSKDLSYTPKSLKTNISVCFLYHNTQKNFFSDFFFNFFEIFSIFSLKLSDRVHQHFQNYFKILFLKKRLHSLSLPDFEVMDHKHLILFTKNFYEQIRIFFSVPRVMVKKKKILFNFLFFNF